jgi:site-specific recombinase XerD
MAFLKKRNGTWYVYWTQGGVKHGKSLKTESKTVADEYLKEFEYRRAKRELGQNLDVALGSLKAEYLGYCKATKKSSTCERHDEPRVTRFVTFLESKGLKKVSEITEAHVQAYQQHLVAERGLSPTSVRHCLYAASGMLTYAVRQGYVRLNVVKNVPKVKATKNPPRFLSFEDWEKLKKVALETYRWPLVATAYYTGFRNSELRFLTWPEIDFDRNAITLTNKPGFTLKNRQSRTVPLNAELKGILQPLRKEKGYCFMNKADRQFDDKELSREFKEVVAKPAGLPECTPHVMRHTFASHLVMRGVSIYKVSQWLGHRSVNTTMIYAHLAPQDDEINVL